MTTYFKRTEEAEENIEKINKKIEEENNQHEDGD